MIKDLLKLNSPSTHLKIDNVPELVSSALELVHCEWLLRGSHLTGQVLVVSIRGFVQKLFQSSVFQHRAAHPGAGRQAVGTASTRFQYLQTAFSLPLV